MSKRSQERRLNRLASPIKFTTSLPNDIDLDDIAWVPTREERQLAWLEEQKAKWDAEELAYYRKRCDQLAFIVAADKAWIDRQNEIEAGMKKVRDYYESEHRKEEQAADKRRLARLKQIIAEVNADICRTERERFAARGLIRGTR